VLVLGKAAHGCIPARRICGENARIRLTWARVKRYRAAWVFVIVTLQDYATRVGSMYNARSLDPFRTELGLERNKTIFILKRTC
jgi:hypothetical protein